MPSFSVRPMDAVGALHSDGDHELSEAIIASLSSAVFGGAKLAPAGLAQRLMARLSYRLLKRTTTQRKKSENEGEASVIQNALLERTGHPYARALLASSSGELESLVEGGDPMNGPYMMIVPEILKAGTTLDRLFLNSVQGKDVQLRFIWETQASYEAAKSRLENGGTVRMKALAAGTGLSMIVAYDRLIREGYEPARITVRITDRDEKNTAKSRRILSKLTITRDRASDTESEGSISAGTEDIFEEHPHNTATAKPYNVVTAVGILEYFAGCTCHTTERRFRLPEAEEPATAHHLVERISQVTAADAALVVNTYRPHSSTRILELFGKKFDYRHRENLSELLANGKFRNPRLIGSGNIYDVEVYEKSPHQ
jgi:hypothetical protein